MGASPETMTIRRRLALAAGFGLTVSVVAVAEWPWPLISGAVFLLIAALLQLTFRRHGGKVQTGPPSPGVALIAATFGTGALLIKESPIAPWAGPMVGMAALIGTFLWLGRPGKIRKLPPTSKS